jgi:hypothetical protein
MTSFGLLYHLYHFYTVDQRHLYMERVDWAQSDPMGAMRTVEE